MQQNATKLPPQQKEFINFVACGQRDLSLRKISYQEFADSIGVERTTLYNWRKSIPNFWSLVASGANSSIDQRVPQILNAMLAKALKGDVSAAKLLLNQAERLKGPPNEEAREDLLNYEDMDIHELFERAIGGPVELETPDDY